MTSSNSDFTQLLKRNKRKDEVELVYGAKIMDTRQEFPTINNMRTIDMLNQAVKATVDNLLRVNENAVYEALQTHLSIGVDMEAINDYRIRDVRVDGNIISAEVDIMPTQALDVIRIEYTF